MSEVATHVEKITAAHRALLAAREQRNQGIAAAMKAGISGYALERLLAEQGSDVALTAPALRAIAGKWKDGDAS